MVSPPTGPSRARQDPPEIAALRRLRGEQPELAAAVDMQIDIVALQRRAQARITTPWVDHDSAWLDERVRQGEPLLHFEDIAFSWLELRLLFRQLTDVLRRFDLIDAPDHAALQTLARASHPATDEVRHWFDLRARRLAPPAPRAAEHGDTFDQVLELSARPFVERASGLVRARADISQWVHPYCPFCGGDPEMAAVAASGRRNLHCGRCTGCWPFDAESCPFCLNREPRLQVSYASNDGMYRILACNACRRYLKALDGRRSDRQLMLAVDTIATLPLDAAAMRQGYAG
jgi:hypothetical protein